MNRKTPVLVVGAGFAGSVIANTLAESGRFRVTVIDQRPHIGGNAYDCVCPDTGVRFHPYGPHIFHTNDTGVFDYLSRFTGWMPYRHRVRAYVEGAGSVPVPINRETLNLLYDAGLANAQQVTAFLDKLRRPIAEPRNALEYLHGLYGPELTELFFASYTEKMWALSLEDLPVSVVARLPVRYDDNPDYFDDRYQMMPSRGYTRLFENLLGSPDIEVRLATRFDKSMEAQYRHCFNSMSIDEYYDYRYGELPYRTIEFEHGNGAPPCGLQVPCVNFTDRGPYTRITRWSLFPGAGGAGKAKSTLEHPAAFEHGANERFYPVRTIDAGPQDRYRMYRELARRHEHMTFIGRCGQYIYYDMHQVVANSLKIARTFLAEQAARRALPQSPAVPGAAVQS